MDYTGTIQWLNTISRNSGTRRSTFGWTCPIPLDNLRHDLFHNFLILLYHGTIKLNHLTKDDWVDIKWLCIDWYFPHQTAIAIRQFCELWQWQLPAMHQFLLQSFTIQQIFTVVSNCRVSDTIAKKSRGHLPDYNNANDDWDNYGCWPGDSLQLSILCHAER